MYAQEIAKRAVTSNLYESMKEAALEINKGSFVYVVDHINAYESLSQDFISEEACRIRELPVLHTTQKESSMVQKNSSIKRIVDFQ